MNLKAIGGLVAGLILTAWAPLAAAQSQSKDPDTATQQKAKKDKKVLSKQEARERYRDARGFEKKGDHAAALNAYLDAGNAGHGRAQKRLGEIYDKGSPATKRDYNASLRWYGKARAQGIEVPKPHTYTKGR